MSNEIILASTSPRRRELLNQIGVLFNVVPSYSDEDFEEGMSPVEVVRMLAERKAKAVGMHNQSSMIIAADTVVALDDSILLKPESEDDAVSTLRRLSGKTHQVHTGVCLYREIDTLIDIFSVTTDVRFGHLSDELIERYVATKEPLDKAGAYGVQGYGALLVESLSGSYFNVVGLPVYEIAEALRRHMGIESVLQKP